MYKAITTVINALPAEFTQNLKSFRRHIHQWASSLQGHKSLPDGSQLNLKANFVEYITYGFHNQYIVDIKEFGELVLQFGAKREEPIVLYQQYLFKISGLTPIRDGTTPEVGLLQTSPLR